MRKVFHTVALSALLLVPATAKAQVHFGIQFGEPPPPRAYRVPPRPNPNSVWVEGYQAPQGSHYKWHNGRWAKAPYRGAYWVEPYHADGRYYAGRWEGDRVSNNRRR